MISICTAAHKVIPFLNLRIINVCSQSFKNWEWVVVDNSKDGCVKKYFDDFFNEMQGVYFPECREKIRVFHEPFDGVEIKDGRVGKVKNLSVKLSTCKNDECFVMLDFDDFLVDGFLNTLNKIANERPDIEYVSGDCVTELCQNIEDGYFVTNDFVSKMYLSKPCNEHLDKLLKYGCQKMKGFSEYCNFYKESSHERFVEVPVGVYMDFPYVSFRLVLRNSNTVNNQFFYLNTYLHPHAYRKGPFFEKIKGFCEDLPTEDIVNLRTPYLLKTMYVKKPCYIQVSMLSNYTKRISGTFDVAKEVVLGNFAKEQEEYEKHCCWERYETLGKNMINPIPFEFYKS